MSDHTDVYMPQRRDLILRKVANLIKRIPPPESEWRDESQSVLLPQNVLLIARYAAEELCRSEAKNPDQHHRYVWILCLKGAGRVGVNQDVFALNEGESMLVLPFQSHFYMNIACDDIHWLFITFEHEKSQKLERIHSLGPVALHGGALEGLHHFVRARFTPQEEFSSRLYLALTLENISKTERPLKQKDAFCERNPNGKLFAKINHFAVENRGRMFTTTEMAAHFGISESNLRSQFRVVTGRSLGLFIRELRLSYACELLQDQTLRMADISLQCGYDSQFNFSRAFRKLFSCTPTEYRHRRKMAMEAGEGL